MNTFLSKLRCHFKLSRAKFTAILPMTLLAVSVGSNVKAQTSLTGAGATFPYPMYSKWFDEYHKLHPEIQINYQSIGSGGGIRQITEGTVDFGASDGPMNNDQLKAYKEKRGMEVLHFPTVLGADVPTYNIPGVTTELKFTPETLAGIFLGKITKWNDPELAKINPDVKLPGEDIVVVHRSDGSGTTYVWVDYLSKVSEEWKNKVGVGTSVNWPVGLGGKGNEGVAGLVKQTPNSIGYVELIYAIQNKMAYGTVKNQAGQFVKADLDSVTAAAAGAAQNMPDDFRISITNAPGEKAYPIASFTWLLIPEKFSDSTKLKVMKDFLAWMLTDGQKMTEALAYAPLPKEVIAKEQQALSKIQ
jgi:phosphate transport system substrate-binding protein